MQVTVCVEGERVQGKGGNPCLSQFDESDRQLVIQIARTLLAWLSGSQPHSLYSRRQNGIFARRQPFWIHHAHFEDKSPPRTRNCLGLDSGG